MRARGLFGITVLAAASVALAAGRPPAALVTTLDRLMQERFETLDGALGISRIATTPEHAGLRAKPEGKAEQQVYGDLSREGWDAVFYVAGRRLLTTADPAPALPIEGSPRRFVVPRALSRPVLLTAGRPRAPFPPDAALTREARQVLTHGRRRDFTAGEWTVTARPIPASSKQCLGCHKTDERGRPLKLGATLGVALYGFAPAGPGARAGEVD